MGVKRLFLVIFLLSLACAEKTVLLPHPGAVWTPVPATSVPPMESPKDTGSSEEEIAENPDITEEVDGNPDIVEEPDVVPISDAYKQECWKSMFLRCPPFDEYWITEAIVDECDNNTIIEIELCTQKFECDPTHPFIKIQNCETPDGRPGIQDVLCDKGSIWLSDCTPCEEEVCDLLDNDCDGETDEGHFECSTACGTATLLCVNGEPICTALEPEEEICNGVDDDCDAETDEHQLNNCGACGPNPEDVCDGFDNDCDENTDEDLIRECTTVCDTGYEICLGGQWDLCSAQKPSPEVCDGFDNDCNGQIDDGIDCQCTLNQLGILVPCTEEPLICGQGYKACECDDELCTSLSMSSCRAACYYFPIPGTTCSEELGIIINEICNNWDDNCNQVIDENLFKACYTGPAGTVGVGICESGLMTCIEGTWGGYTDENVFFEDYCEGQVLPLSEELCNGLDDNCDGLVEETMEDTDIDFIIDMSGSMGSEITAVADALMMFSLNYSDETVIRWALLTVADRDWTLAYDFLTLRYDFGPFSGFLSSLNAIDLNALHGSMEMFNDAIYLSIYALIDPNVTIASYPIAMSNMNWTGHTASSPALPNFYLTWREDSKKVIIIFTDELPQGYMMPEITQEILINGVNTIEDMKVFVFSPLSVKNYTWVLGWEPITMAGDVGQWYELSHSSEDMFNNLMEILDNTACAEE